MKVLKTSISGVLVLEPEVHKDNRGYFLESWNKKIFQTITKSDLNFVQDNHSHSLRGVLRGLHYQLLKPQGKLVRVINGEILDVVVDIRRSSKTFGKHLTINLSGKNQKQIWIPPGCAHGFLVISEFADFFYKVTDYYSAKDEHCIIWNDPDLNIDWKMKNITPRISEKDLKGNYFKHSLIYD
jgi:dTDP-4-dehydrorhamnose 3,5-epimerase